MNEAHPGLSPSSCHSSHLGCFPPDRSTSGSQGALAEPQRSTEAPKSAGIPKLSLFVKRQTRCKASPWGRGTQSITEEQMERKRTSISQKLLGKAFGLWIVIRPPGTTGGLAESIRCALGHWERFKGWGTQQAWAWRGAGRLRKAAEVLRQEFGVGVGCRGSGVGGSLLGVILKSSQIWRQIHPTEP